MTSGDVSSASPGAFEPDISAPHVKNSYPTCNERGLRRRRPLPPPSVPPLVEGADGGR
ncbi:hypothetical protein ACQKGO_01595 [Corallococcus interemptor]|uniref:hypothetical protein n=1 Tax=Corallococcus TaxID=83461 RepID=UPI00131537BC|nr:hypothetical protein [Corallococcus sp. AB049A]